MANIIITLKIMPEGVETDLDKLEKEVEGKLEGEMKKEREEIAFGLKALKFMFIWDEDKGNVDSLEEEIKKIDGVRSVEVVDVRRAIG